MAKNKAGENGIIAAIKNAENGTIAPNTEAGTESTESTDQNAAQQTVDVLAKKATTPKTGENKANIAAKSKGAVKPKAGENKANIVAKSKSAVKPKQETEDEIKQRLIALSGGYFERLKEIDNLFATPDGFMFVSKNDAGMHARQNNFKVYPITRAEYKNEENE